MLALTTVYLEYAGYDWPVLGQVGGNLLIFDKYSGVILRSHSGIFRASEIAAWHAMTCACFVLLLATWRKINFQTLLTAAIVVALLVGIAVLTGRRKAVVEVAVFASTYFILWVVFKKSVAKFGICFGNCRTGRIWLVGRHNWEGDSLSTSHEDRQAILSMSSEAKPCFEDAPARFVELGIAPIMWAYDSFGLFGAGLGVGTQGTQHFGGEEASQGQQKAGWARSRLSWAFPAFLWWGGLQFQFLTISGGSCELHREFHQGSPDFLMVFSVFSWPTWRRSRLPRRRMATCSYC